MTDWRLVGAGLIGSTGAGIAVCAWCAFYSAQTRAQVPPQPIRCYQTFPQGQCGQNGNSPNGEVCGPGQPPCWFVTYWAGNLYECRDVSVGSSSCERDTCEAWQQRWKCEDGHCVKDGAAERLASIPYWKAAITPLCQSGGEPQE